jgi:hypothetical protein
VRAVCDRAELIVEVELGDQVVDVADRAGRTEVPVLHQHERLAREARALEGAGAERRLIELTAADRPGLTRGRGLLVHGRFGLG